MSERNSAQLRHHPNVPYEDRLADLARAYHQLYQHTVEQQRICPACVALDPGLVLNRQGGPRES